MAEFHVGDRVRLTGENGARAVRKTFTITEFKEFDGELHATGEDRAWWPIRLLDYAKER